MKKIFKIIIIVLVVLLAVVGAVVVFFNNLKKEENSSQSLVEYLYKADELDWSTVNYDNKFDQIIATNENLEDSLFALSAYLINENISVSDNSIISKLREVEGSLSLAKAMIAEYDKKDDSTFFDKNLGRNDLYSTLCEYVVDYASMINMINSQLNNNSVNKSADVKFDMIDLYCRVVVNTYSTAKVNETSKLVEIEHLNNLNLMNAYFCMETSYLTRKPVGSMYPMINTSNNNLFTKYYNKCDKEEFAKKLAENVNTFENINETSTDVERATHYFELIYGI